MNINNDNIIKTDNSNNNNDNDGNINIDNNTPNTNNTLNNKNNAKPQSNTLFMIPPDNADHKVTMNNSTNINNDQI